MKRNRRTVAITFQIDEFEGIVLDFYSFNAPLASESGSSSIFSKSNKMGFQKSIKNGFITGILSVGVTSQL